MNVLLFLLGAVVAGILLGVILYFAKKSVMDRIQKEKRSAMGDLDKRYFAISDDLKLIQDMGNLLSGKYKNATPEKVARIKELASSFESGWIARRKMVQDPSNQTEATTTYELDKMMDELEVLVKEVFTP